jgi:predicted enzyme related to lactoylglutathione lyase
MDMGPQGTYRVLKHGDTPRAGIMGEKGATPHGLPYVGVDDCDAALARAQRAGGKLEVPATDIPTVGRFGIFRDPQGARLGIIKPLPR